MPEAVADDLYAAMVGINRMQQYRCGSFAGQEAVGIAGRLQAISLQIVVDGAGVEVAVYPGQQDVGVLLILEQVGRLCESGMGSSLAEWGQVLTQQSIVPHSRSY